MKKIIYLASIFSVALMFTSCFEKIDNWYTETSPYDGRFVVSATCDEYSSDDVPLSDGMEMWVFNTANNTPNEIWIDNFSIAGFHMKAKLNVTGDASSFKTDADTKLFYDSETTYVLDNNGNPVAYYPPAAPTVAGTTIDCVTLYTRISVDSAFVTKAGATTPGGNKSDSVYMRTTLYHDAFQAESYQTDASTWANPLIPEFDWRVVDGSVGNADGWEEHWTLSGYRYTGFPEDIGKNPPIVEN
jgi:hypothetical protein